jgi:hypothetical protein
MSPAIVARSEMLSERQKTAAAIAGELHRLGAWVVSPLPLDDKQALRWVVLDTDREAVLEKVVGWGWSPILKNTVPRMTAKGPEPATTYEIDLPRPRQVVVDTRIIPRSEVVERKRTADEVAAVKKHLGIV